MTNIILTKEQIQYIDNYLQELGVFYVDVRAEMIDHIASATEEKMQSENLEFDDAFEDYMVSNKRSLLSRNNKFNGYFQEAILNFLKTLYRPLNLVFGIFFMVALIYFDCLKYIKTINDEILNYFALFSIIQIIYLRIIRRKRYLCIDNLLNILLVIIFITGFNERFYDYSLYNGIILFLNFSFASYYVVTIRKFILSYKLWNL